MQFRQNTMISPLKIFMPDLYERLFDPEYIPEASEDDPTQGVLFPTTDEEFEQMVAEWGLED